MLSQIVLGLATVASLASGSPIQKRATVPHDSITPLAENVPNDAIGNAVKKFAPFLHIAHGCQSYPAVDASGNTSGGLQDTGSSTGGCRDETKGQTYVRTAKHGANFAIMYSWYMAKDMPTDGVSAGSHRHDWENVVVFIDSPEAGNLISAGASGHGEYKKTATPQSNGSRLKVEYFTSFPTNHELQFTETEGKGDLPLIFWDALDEPIRTGLSQAKFGKANVPFKDDNFVSNLDKAVM
ncbi:NPP1-domain-containing protein [Bimuria novae-zelandiae CBS 107.79]|uniref:NPP1-domain-containing protein n=1 Tax=Bimuria novae-zelandiae CBS 107.79 TaxID=1447943 RepID=A0A6A5UR55_9PLEO|nr:NPP1-domain-containing protein [Bimuria novae-zelandiae CBS 107.79]